MGCGVWTPLFCMFPAADVPVCCLSVRSDLDAEAHIRDHWLVCVPKACWLLGRGRSCIWGSICTHSATPQLASQRCVIAALCIV